MYMTTINTQIEINAPVERFLNIILIQIT